MRVRMRARPGRREGSICVLEPRTDEAFTALVAKVAPALEAALPQNVYANRLRDPARFQFEDWRIARDRFEGALAELVGAVGVRLDVEDCYGSMRPAVVAAAVEGLRRGTGEWVEAALRRFERAGVRGLPIGPGASDVLANAVLLDLDRMLAAQAVGWARWVDDVVVTAGDLAALADAERASEEALARNGLRWNQAKRRRLRPGDRWALRPCLSRGRPVRGWGP